MAVTNLDTGQVINEAWVDSVSGRLNGTTGDAGTTYTPTLTQSGSVTKTTNRAAYTKIGRRLFGDVCMTMTGSGTISNQILVGLPLAAAGTYHANSILGSGTLIDTSAAQTYHFLLMYSSSTTCSLYNSSGAFLGGAGFTAALASGDIITYNFNYEASS